MRTSRRVWADVVVAGGLALGSVPPPARGQEILIPAGWAGTWRMTLTARTAVTADVVRVDRITDRLCAGEPVGLTLFAERMRCTSAISEDALTADCVAHVTTATCEVNGTGRFAATRTGDTLAGSGQWAATATGLCGPLPPSASETIDLAGARIDPDETSPSPTPWAPPRWRTRR